LTSESAAGKPEPYEPGSFVLNDTADAEAQTLLGMKVGE
jgi:hypothetical protein